MIRVAFCIPGDLTLPTGGYRYDREVLARLPREGVDPVHLQLPGAFPAPSEADLAETARLLSMVDRRSLLLIDGLALGAMAPEMVAPYSGRTVALVHHPLGLEAGLDADRAAFLMANEQAVLRHVRHVVVTSDTTRRILKDDFGVRSQMITVAEPGTAPAVRAAGNGSPVTLLAVGAISRRKAYDRLVGALASVAGGHWHLTIAGSLERDPEAVAALRETLAKSDLSERVTLAGAVGDAALEALYNQCDIFVSASLFEGYGMALAEALAHGLPVVTSDGGAAADTVPDAAAIKVPAGDTTALSQALGAVIGDNALRRRMADAAWAAAALLPTWDDTAHDIADVLKTIA